MGDYNRVQLPIYALGAPSLHKRQHEIADENSLLQSTERALSNDSFGDRSMLRLRELRCDKRNGKIKTTQLYITNANFNAEYGKLDSYGEDLQELDYDYGFGALRIRSGGAFIGGGCRVTGQLSSSISYNDVPSTLPQHNTNLLQKKRIRMYQPIMDAPHAQHLLAVAVQPSTETLPSGNYIIRNLEIPTGLQALCGNHNRGEGNGVEYSFFVQGRGHLGRGCAVQTSDKTYDFMADDDGEYEILISGLRADPATNGAARGIQLDPMTTGIYDEPFPGLPKP